MINSKDGSILWQFEDKNKQQSLIMDIYTANFIPDQDEDGFSDILASHTAQKGIFGV